MITSCIDIQEKAVFTTINNALQAHFSKFISIKYMIPRQSWLRCLKPFENNYNYWYYCYQKKIKVVRKLVKHKTLTKKYNKKQTLNLKDPTGGRAYGIPLNA